MRPVSPDDRTIDATGKFILPSLIDAHCHISRRRELAHGSTAFGLDKIAAAPD
jgi:imidazolonepropionase-like amidohydrolase